MKKEEVEEVEITFVPKYQPKREPKLTHKCCEKIRQTTDTR